METCRVYLVGAGPGDPSLISVRGLRCLEAAGVVVFDHRVHGRLLRLAPADAERIDVGAAAPKPLDQDAICFLLAEKAREGKTVVRLKWGDPFVFDSGGKEALFLHEQGVPFEVIPGIPAAIGGPAYAGVPVTYPEAGDVLTFVRGHEGETDAPPDVDWTRLAGIEGTIVCYAGARQVGAICDALRANGRSSDEPAALIYAATMPSQVTVQGTISTIASQVKNGHSAALLVIGAVTSLRDHLRWFDDRPLFGRRIVVTRSREQAGEFIEMLEDRGAEAIPAPTIRVLPPEDPTALEKAAREAGSYDWIVFTSANAVDHYMKSLVAVSDVRELKGVRICTIGPSTASRLSKFGIRVDLTPTEFRSEALIEAMTSRGRLHGARVLLPRADIAKELLAEELRGAGARVVEVTAYRTVLASDRDGDHDVYRMLLDRQIDAVTFTSASTVRNFVEILGQDQAVDLLRTTVVASIGPVTAEAAQQLDIVTSVMPERYTIPDLVDALVTHFASHPTAGALR